MTQTQDLANTGIIVTGSSRGVGAATAQRLAHRGAGIVINYRQKAPRANKVVKQIEEAGGKAGAVGRDLSIAVDWEKMINAAESHFGDLNVLVLMACGCSLCDFGADYVG